MRLTAIFMGFVVAAAVSGGALLPAGPSHAASGEEVIKARVSFMKDELEANWKPLAAFGKSGTGSLADVEKHARALAKLSAKIPSHFPKDTGRGNFPDKLTRALPVIWTDWDGFNKSVKKFSEGSEELARLASQGNKDAVVEMIGTSGRYGATKIGCADCHKTFQGERVK